MDNIPFVREVTSVFSVQGGPNTAASMNALINNLLKWTYIILSLVVVFGGSYYIFNVMQRQIAGILYFLASIILVYFYYVKWFLVPLKNPEWPPYQSMCPDFLTPITPGYTTNDGVTSIDPNAGIQCVDFVGVSQNGLLKVADPGNLTNQLNMPQYSITVKPSMTRDELKALLDTYGLTWHGMFPDVPPAS
jgi:hypothetical protein